MYSYIKSIKIHKTKISKSNIPRLVQLSKLVWVPQFSPIYDKNFENSFQRETTTAAAHHLSTFYITQLFWEGFWPLHLLFFYLVKKYFSIAAIGQLSHNFNVPLNVSLTKMNVWTPKMTNHYNSAYKFSIINLLTRNTFWRRHSTFGQLRDFQTFNVFFSSFFLNWHSHVSVFEIIQSLKSLCHNSLLTSLGNKRLDDVSDRFSPLLPNHSSPTHRQGGNPPS